jgi:hypothetical protein
MTDMPSYLFGSVMVKEEQVRERVKKGAAHLDQVRSGWRNEINLEKLDMTSAFYCILGLLYGGIHEGCTDSGLISTESPAYIPSPLYWETVCDHGFGVKYNEVYTSDEVNAGEKDWSFPSSRILTKLWREEIESHKGGQSSEPATAG